MKNSKNILIVLCVLVAILIIVLLSKKSDSQSIQPKPDTNLAVNATNPVAENKTNSDLQTKCSIEAKKVFDTFSPWRGVDTYTYKYHYNTNGTCYVSINGYGEGGKEMVLLNANEDKIIAQCDYYDKTSSLNLCGYNSLNLSKEFNVDEFNKFIKPYMEN